MFNNMSKSMGSENSNSSSSNSMQNQMSTNVSDKEMLTDELSSQKFATSSYNTFATECSSKDIKNQLMNILNEEHQIQFDVFQEMQKRGWYQTEPAQENKINQAKQKFSSQSK